MDRKISLKPVGAVFRVYIYIYIFFFSILADDAPTIFSIYIFLIRSIYIYIYIFFDRNEEEIYLKIDGASSERMEKCLNSNSNRDPPAYAADCSAVDLWRPRPDSRAIGHLNHLASASGPPHRRDLGFLRFLNGTTTV